MKKLLVGGLIGAGALFGVNKVLGQEQYNYELLPGMDPYTTPNIFNQGNTEWENASREEKIQMIDAANREDKSWEWKYETGFSCGEFAKLKLVDLFGVEDFENYDYFFAFENNYKKEKNGLGNIPIYWVATMPDPDALQNVNIITLYGHAINGAFVGPENPQEKEDPTNFNQWVFFEPQRNGENGTYYVKPGDWQIDDNGPVTIYWFGNYPIDGVWKPGDWQILQYKLTNGVAQLDVGFSEDGVNNSLIKENPNTLSIDFVSSPSEVYQEYGESLPTLSSSDWSTNSEYYSDRIKGLREVSDTTNVNISYPEYEYNYQVKDSVGMKVGRHEIGNSKEYTVKVRDTTAPTVQNLEKKTIGYFKNGEAGENVTPENVNIGYPEATDNSGLPVSIDFEREFLGQEGNLEHWRINYDIYDKATNPNHTYVSQEVDVDLTVGIRNDKLSLAEFRIYPNPATDWLQVEMPAFGLNSTVHFRVLTLAGREVRCFTEVSTERTTLSLKGLPSGIYLLQVLSGNDSQQEIFIKN